MNYDELLAVARKQFGTLSVESEIVSVDDKLMVVGRVTTAKGTYNSLHPVGPLDFERIVELQEVAEMQALHKAGVTPGADQAEVRRADPLPSMRRERVEPSPSAYRQVLPAMPAEVADTPCAQCGNRIYDYFSGSMYLTAARVVEATKKVHGRALCAECSGKEAAANVRSRSKVTRGTGSAQA